MKKLLCSFENGVEVYVCNYTYTHMMAHADVDMSHIVEAISKISPADGQTFIMQNIDLGRIIGKDNCVAVNEEDDVRIVTRPNRAGQTPIVYNREAEDTSLINVGLCLDEEDGLWTMFTAFYGILAPKEPWDFRLKDEEREESIQFWSTHALVNQ